METNYKLMETNGGYSLIHTKGLTKQEADEMRDHHADLFPEGDWWVQPHDEDDDKEDEPRHYNEKAVDGWEDIYSHD